MIQLIGIISFIQENTEIIIVCCILAAGLLAYLLYLFFRSPFKFPYCRVLLNVSGRRKPVAEEIIDEWLNSGGFDTIEKHEMDISQWKTECEDKIQKSLFKNLRKKQFLQCLDNKAYLFCLCRNQTRYTQRNYVKHPYLTIQSVDEVRCDFDWIQRRYSMLKGINFETTVAKYQRGEQRKLMTRALREQIMKRDNYTCQICGKYMPDEVGLQVDHIIPIKNGGKSVPSNLQVLCSKCNGSKSDKSYNKPNKRIKGTLVER